MSSGSENCQAQQMGSSLLTVGIQEWHNDDYLSPSMQATSTGASSSENSWRLDGTKIVVEFAEESQKILVTARADDGMGLFLASLDDAGISKEPGTSIRLQPVHEIAFSDVSAELVGEISQPGSSSSVVWLTRVATALLCATQVGVLDKALKMTAEYTSTREQFGRPIATFQAVTQSLANQFNACERRKTHRSQRALSYEHYRRRRGRRRRSQRRRHRQ